MTAGLYELAPVVLGALIALAGTLVVRLTERYEEEPERVEWDAKDVMEYVASNGRLYPHDYQDQAAAVRFSEFSAWYGRLRARGWKLVREEHTEGGA